MEQYTDNLPQQHTRPAPPAPKARGTARAGCVAALVAFLVASFVGLAAGFAGTRLALMGDLGDLDGTSTITVIEGPTDEPVVAVAVKAIPSVVNIDVTSLLDVGPGDGENDLPEAHPDVPVLGNGSGVAYRADPEGGTFILTNDHVVADAETIVVTDWKGNRSPGRVVGTDPNTDIAVIHVAADVPTIETGDSDDLAVGSLVVAIGSPFGLRESVTSGVISAIGRSLPDSTSGSGTYPLVDVIQTDAAINPGNSGGALLDRQGRLVGINTAIFSETGVNDGIGFAVPVNSVIRVADEIIRSGEARYPFLGILGQTVTEMLAEEEDLPVDEGALVVEVTENTGAEEGGIRVDDIIVGYDGDVVHSMDDLILLVRRSHIGDSVVIDLYRDGELIEVPITVGDKPDDI